MFANRTSGDLRKFSSSTSYARSKVLRPQPKQEFLISGPLLHCILTKTMIWHVLGHDVHVCVHLVPHVQNAVHVPHYIGELRPQTQGLHQRMAVAAHAARWIRSTVTSTNMSQEEKKKARKEG